MPAFAVSDPSEAVEQLQQQKHPTTAQRGVEAKEKETVPHGWLGGGADWNLYLHYPSEHRQAVARGRIS